MRRSVVPVLFSLIAAIMPVSPAAAQLDLFPPSYGSISGEVTDAAGNPLAGICVSVFNLDGYDYAVTSTGEDGTYRVTDLPEDSYKVQFSEYCLRRKGGSPQPVAASGSSSSSSSVIVVAFAPRRGYLTEWFDDKLNFESADPVPVHAGADTPHIDAALTLGGRISGRVTNAAGQGLGSICVGAYVDVYSFAEGGYTAGDGGYTVVGLRTGDYRVKFSDCSYPPIYLAEWYNDRPDFWTADPVGVTETAVTAGIDAVLAPAPVIDLAVTHLAVENVPVRTDYGDVGYTGWVRRVRVEVSNLGEAVPEYANLAVEACTRSDGACRRLDDWVELKLAPGERRTFTFDWNGFGQAGDVRVEARVWAFADRHPDNDSRRVDHYVIVGGTGFGLTPACLIFYYYCPY